MSKLYKNTLYITVFRILGPIITFLLLPVYTHYLSPDEFGILNMIQTIGAILQIIFTLGLEKSIYRLYYDYNEIDRKKYLGTIIVSVLVIISFSFSLIIIFEKQIFEIVFSSIEYSPYLKIGALNIAIVSFLSVPQAIKIVKEDIKKIVILDFVNIFIQTLLRLVFLIVLGKGVLYQVMAMTITNAILIPIYIYLTKHDFILNWNKEYLNDALRFSLPFIPTLLFSWVLNLSDRLFIERMVNLNQLGVYSLAAKISSIIIILGGAFFKAYNPAFFKLVNGSKENNSELIKMNTIGYIYMITISFFVTFLSEEIINIFFSKEYNGAGIIIIILAIANAFNILSAIYSSCIKQLKKTSWLSGIYGISALINIIANYFFILKFGIFGAAIATLGSSLFSFSMQKIVSLKNLHIGHNSSVVNNYLFIVVSIVIISGLAQDNFVSSSLFFLTKILIVIILYTYLNHRYRLFKKIKNLFVK